MKPLEIDSALSEIMLKKIAESKKKLIALPKEAKTERKAVQIELGMYQMFLNFGQLYDVKQGETVEEQRTHVLTIREKMMHRLEHLSLFPKIREIYDLADEEEKKRIIAAFHGEMNMRAQMYSKYVKEWEAAKQCGDAPQAFETGLKVAVVEEGFRIWEQWRKENNVYPDMF